MAIPLKNLLPSHTNQFKNQPFHNSSTHCFDVYLHITKKQFPIMFSFVCGLHLHVNLYVLGPEALLSSQEASFCQQQFRI